MSKSEGIETVSYLLSYDTYNNYGTIFKDIPRNIKKFNHLKHKIYLSVNHYKFIMFRFFEK